MPAQLVPAIKTIYTSQQMIRGFIEGWQQHFNALPKKESVAVLWAQNAIETGSTTSMWNNNIGNVKFVASANPADDDGKEYMMLNNVWEIINGQKVIYQPPHTATWFRSFKTLADGVAFHMDFLKNRRYKTAWTAVEAGDPAQFAHLLKVARYYTDTEENYARNMNYYFNKFMKDTTFEIVVKELSEPKLIITKDGQVIIPEDMGTKTDKTVISKILSFFGKK
jgi:flagellum-specific peptidoglycan hydrolase FlgJ